jgi:hypothetical protein
MKKYLNISPECPIKIWVIFLLFSGGCTRVDMGLKGEKNLDFSIN